MTDRRGQGPSLLTGLWHVHTDRTDGEHSLPDLLDFAATSGFRQVTIAEHVRRELTYDFADLYAEAKRLAADRDLTCLVGCEAKVLDRDGTLDASPATLRRADVVYAAFHGSRFDRAAYLEAVTATLANPTVDVWAHPFAYATRNGLELGAEERDRLLDAVREHGVLFELNLRRPATEVVPWASLRGVRKVIGYDLHDVGNWTGRPGGDDDPAP